MIKNLKNEKCCGCHGCFNICPSKAINIINDDKGFKQPIIVKDKCINCNLCKKVCPLLNSMTSKYETIAYAAYNKNNSERMNSSSGGIFALIAKQIIKKDGYVFGAAYDSEYRVKHIGISKVEDLYKIMGSKYVQSTIGNSYKQVRELLEKNKYVLFTGTPCQIEGLKFFLRKDYTKLITQDLICHGVPSPKVWEKYKSYHKKNTNKKLTNISFRNKEHGWTSYHINFSYDTDVYSENHKNDLYMQAFLWDVSLRDSCFDCNFKKKNRISDITLGDYWGIENIHKELFDDKGTSLVVIHSDKGLNLFDSIKNEIIYKKTNLDDAIIYNSAIIKSSECGKNRERFFDNIEKYNFDKLITRYIERNSLKWKMKLRVKRIIKKVIR